MSGMGDVKQVEGDVPMDTENSAQREEEVIKKKYGGIVPKKPPLISKDHERAYFDSADWALSKQGVEKPKGPLEALRPKLQEAEEPDAFAIERERLAIECKAIKEQYLKEEAIRLKKFEADMRRELIEKYFSDKDIFGDKIFEETGVDGVKAGRSAGAESYADPVAYLKKKEASAKSAANTSTGKGKQVTWIG